MRQYACRKTLADNRPRIRGRFARNDEAGDVPKVASSARDVDDDEFWVKFLLLSFFFFCPFKNSSFTRSQAYSLGRLMRLRLVIHNECLRRFRRVNLKFEFELMLDCQNFALFPA